MVTTYAKHHLPNYGVFDEFRYFEPGNDLQVRPGPRDRRRRRDLRGPLAGRRPGRRGREAGAGLLAVINASPYERDKDDTRGELVARRAREAGCPLAYVNLVGGQDELVFDGDTMIGDADGEIVVRALQFVEELWSPISTSRPRRWTERAEGTVPASPAERDDIVRHASRRRRHAPAELPEPIVAKPA